MTSVPDPAAAAEWSSAGGDAPTWAPSFATIADGSQAWPDPPPPVEPALIESVPVAPNPLPGGQFDAGQLVDQPPTFQTASFRNASFEPVSIQPVPNGSAENGTSDGATVSDDPARSAEPSRPDEATQPDELLARSLSQDPSLSQDRTQPQESSRPQEQPSLGHDDGHGHPAATAPESLFSDPAAEARWRDRFSAARVSLPDPARDDPQRAVYVSNESGRYELVCWDIPSGAKLQATDRADGTASGTLSADGRSLWWFDDTGGDEFGAWKYQPFGSVPSTASVALPGVRPGYAAGVEVGRTLAIVGFSDDDGTRIHLAHGGPARVVYQHESDGGVTGLSADESIWVLSHSERGDSRYPALRAYAVDGGAVIGDLDDGSGKGVGVADFSPVPGDLRVLVGHERHGRDELGIWDLQTGTFTELDIDLPGDLDGAFYPDASAVLVIHAHAGRSTLHRYDLRTAALTGIPAATGVVSGAIARKDGSVWYRHSSAATGWQLRSLAPDGTDQLLIVPPDGGPPDSEPVIDVWVDGSGGRIHALLSRPSGTGEAGAGDLSHHALPTVFLVHGGPTAADEDSFDAERAAYLDAGLAVCQVNYRGSTGYGSAWRDANAERVGHIELADIAAVHDHLVTTGWVDADASAIVGHSWGGYLALLAVGTQPSRWSAAVAGVPVADYVAAYEDEMEPLRAFDRALFGGSPDERPDAYADSSPLSYVRQVRTPLLVLAGENDPRCPIRQIDNYLDALAAQHADYRVYR